MWVMANFVFNYNLSKNKGRRIKAKKKCIQDNQTVFPQPRLRMKSHDQIKIIKILTAFNNKKCCSKLNLLAINYFLQ